MRTQKILLLFLATILLIVALTSASLPNGSVVDYQPFNTSISDLSLVNMQWINAGTPSIITSPGADVKWGIGSVYLPGGTGTTQLLYSTNTSNFNFGTNNFTVAFWFNQTASHNTYDNIIGNYPTGNGAGWGIGYGTSGGGNQYNIQFSRYTGSWTTLWSTTSFSALNMWHYIVCERSGNTFSIYVDGVLNGTSTSASTIGSTTQYPSIGGQYGVSASVGATGYLDDLIVYNGIAIDGTKVPDREMLTNPNAGFTSSATSGTAPLTVSITNTSAGNVAAQSWAYYIHNLTSTQDVLQSNLASPTISNLPMGNYTLTQVVSNTFGSSNATSWINVTFPVTFPISISNLQIWNISLPTQALTQTAPYTYQPGNFGGLPAQIPLTSGNPVVHTYTSPNAGYTVTDTAWDQYGGFSQATGTVPVYIGVPYASFTESPTSGQASLLVTFTDTSYRGTASGLSYNWSFGDSSGTNPYSNVIGNTTHVYAYNGVFYPNLTITNANGTSYYVGQPITLSNTQTQTYYLPTQVQLKFTDYNGAPLTGVSVVATPINFSAPAGWINTLLGINPNVNIVGTSVGLNTDTLGVCAMPMVQSIEYSIVVKGTSASNPAETVNTTFNLFPVQTAYEIPLPTNLVPYALPTPQTATTNITYSITNTTGASTQTYTTTYNDATGGTTALQLFVENTTGAWIASSNYTGSAANSETFSQSEPNPNGGTYTWGFLATQAQLGNITQTKTANFPEFINLMGAPGGWPT